MEKPNSNNYVLVKILTVQAFKVMSELFYSTPS